MASERLALAPGAVLAGTYEIVRRVGAGGMGEVYEARHTRLPGRFAIKVLTGEGTLDPALRRRFRREAEIASSLRHPNIVHVVDFNETPEGQPFLAMELLEGHDLAAELARNGAMDVRRAVAIVDQVASALAAAHGRGVVHRDLKPQNVLLVPVPGQKGREIAKVVDFGISKSIGSQTLTGEGLVGTPRYMAPEQAESRGGEIDGRTDQFALGAIAYEMLSGRPAFGAEDVPATLHRIVHEEPAPLGAWLPDVGAALDPVLRRAMAKDRTRRFVSVLELGDALAAAAGVRPRVPPEAAVATLPRGAASPISPRRSRRRLHVLAASGAAALAVAAAIAVLARREAGRAPAAPAVAGRAAPPALPVRPAPPPAPRPDPEPGAASRPVEPPPAAVAARPPAAPPAQIAPGRSRPAARRPPRPPSPGETSPRPAPVRAAPAPLAPPGAEASPTRPTPPRPPGFIMKL